MLRHLEDYTICGLPSSVLSSRISYEYPLFERLRSEIVPIVGCYLIQYGQKFLSSLNKYSRLMFF